MAEVYVSTDIEANGPIPGVYSMLSFASAAFDENKNLVSTFSANLETLPNAMTDPETMKFWRQNPEAWSNCRENIIKPVEAMTNYLKWLKTLSGTPIFVGYPATYDFMFIYWYLINFTGESPFEYRGLDIRTYAMAILKKPYLDSGKINMPKNWFSDFPNTHTALDDAIEQGYLFCNMLVENISKNN